jgi:transposase
MEVLYPSCAGLDVHKDTVVAAARLAANDPTRSKVRTFDTTTPGLLALSAWLAECGCTHVAMEATGVYWKPVWHILSDGEFTLILANAAHVRNVPGRKTDVADAVWLAELLAHGLIRASFVPETPTQEMRALLRTRKQLVREQASHIQRIQKTLEDANLKLWLGAEPDHGQVRPHHYRGADRRGTRSRCAARSRAARRQGAAGKAAGRVARASDRTASLPVAVASSPF